MNKNRSLFTCALVFCAQEASAAITVDGIWTDNDWYDDTAMIGVDNGIPYSNDTQVHHMLRAPLSFDGSIDAYLD